MVRLIAPLSALVLLLVLSAACGRSPAPTSTPAPVSISPEEVIERSSAAMASLQSFRFKLSHVAGATALPGGVNLDRAEGAVISPDKLEVSADASLGRNFVKLGAVVLGPDTYVLNPLTSSWVKVSSQSGSPLSVFDPAKLVGGILEQLQFPRFTTGPGLQEGDYMITGTAPAKILESLVGETDPERKVNFDLRIDASSFHLKRAEIRGAVSAAEAMGIIRIVELTDFDTVGAIRPPI